MLAAVISFILPWKTDITRCPSANAVSDFVLLLSNARNYSFPVGAAVGAIGAIFDRILL